MKKRKLIDWTELIAFLTFLISVIWLLIDFFKAVFKGPFQLNATTSFGIAMIVCFIVFIFPPMWAVLVEKSKKKTNKK